uniref:Origin recognition complex subunit 5 n=2 Tax=Ciona intestinalis TaxID=7719 RepID=F6TBB0_CIOIN
ENMAKNSLPARNRQIEQLTNLFGEKHHHTVESLYIYGHTGSGKSCVLNHVLVGNDLFHVVVNCIECYTTNLLFSTILEALSFEEGRIRCDNMNDFVRCLRKIVEEREVEETLYIVFENCERLRDKDPILLPALLNLKELTGLNLCAIFVSELPWEKFYNGTAIRDPYVMFFPDYSKDELVEVLCHLRPQETDLEFYKQYVGLVLSMFFFAFRDLRELRHLVEINFSFYEQPIVDGKLTKDDKHKLWKNIEPHLTSSLQKLLMREACNGRQSNEPELTESIKAYDLSKGNTVKSQNLVELPFYSKFLLISSYIASYNPSSTDRRFFLKHAGRMRKTARSMKKDDHKNCHLRGPHSFPLDRMMAIFYSIVDEVVPPSAGLFSQISSLVSLHLLAQLGQDQLDMPKYKCTVSLDFITAISKTVNFDVIRYLYDFV